MARSQLTAECLCPVVTPFKQDSVSTEDLQAIVQHVISGGVDGIVPCGTTGEFASLTQGEFQKVVNTVVENTPEEIPVISGVGSTSISETLNKINIAEQIGADAVLVVLPYFHGSNNNQGQIQFFERIIKSSPLPIILYNIPDCVGESIEIETISQLAQHSKVIGMKDSSGDFDYFLKVLQKSPPDFQLFQGFDSLLIPSLLMGADGGINALANVIPESFDRGIRAVQEGNTGEAISIQQEIISPLFQHCLLHGFTPVCKIALLELDIISSEEVRPPLVQLDESVQQEIKSILRTL